MHAKQLTCSHGNLCIKDVISFCFTRSIILFQCLFFTALAYIV